jgi:hypothetical protein
MASETFSYTTKPVFLGEGVRPRRAWSSGVEFCSQAASTLFQLESFFSILKSDSPLLLRRFLLSIGGAGSNSSLPPDLSGRAKHSHPRNLEDEWRAGNWIDGNKTVNSDLSRPLQTS